MKEYRFLFACLYGYIVAPFIFNSMILLGDYGMWERIQAFSVIAVIGVLETVLLHLLNHKHKLTGAFQVAITVIDLIMLCLVFAVVTLSLQQSHIVVANLISGYAVMLAFVSLRIWDYIYIDKSIYKKLE